MNTDNLDQKAIYEVINHYFHGTYEGNASLIKRAFHPDAHITGLIQGQYYDWTREEFINHLIQEPSSSAKKEPYDKKIINIDCHNDAAMVKARVVVGNYIFVDYIILLKIEGNWIIRNKSFTSQRH